MNLELDLPAIDYITATSFKPKLYELTTSSLLPQMIEQFDWLEQLSEAKLLQYRGLQAIDRSKKQTAFAGEGRQKQQPHFLFRTSSAPADFAYRRLLNLELDYNPTRIDVQLTCEPETEAKAKLWKQFFEDQYGHEQTKGARARKVTLVTDNNRAHTLYVGSRASDRFIRTYQKTVSERGSKDKRSLVRLEIELKGRRATACHRQAQHSGLDQAMIAVLQDTLEGLVHTPLLEPHRLVVDQFSPVEPWREQSSVSTIDCTLEWFEQACIAVAIRMLSGKQTKTDISSLIVQLVRQALPNLDAQAKKQLVELLNKDLQNQSHSSEARVDLLEQSSSEG